MHCLSSDFRVWNIVGLIDSQGIPVLCRTSLGIPAKSLMDNTGLASFVSLNAYCGSNLSCVSRLIEILLRLLHLAFARIKRQCWL